MHFHQLSPMSGWEWYTDRRFPPLSRLDLLAYAASADSLLYMFAYARPPHTTFSSLTALKNPLVAIVYAFQYFSSYVLGYHNSVIAQH